MRRGWTVGLTLAWLLGCAWLSNPVDGAVRQSNFRNIQVLTDMSDRDIQLTMQDWARQFDVTCFECHVQGDFASDENERKRTARRMAGIVRALNQTAWFAESTRKADCFLCHQGSFTIPEFD